MGMTDGSRGGKRPAASHQSLWI